MGFGIVHYHRRSISIFKLSDIVMFDFFRSRRTEETEPIDFVPSIQINPNSSLFVECTPTDPHTASNIVINSYVSKTNRALLQTRIQWSRFKMVTESQHSI